MGEIGVQMSDPDTPALDILNEILNSFGGRLFNEIRSKEVGVQSAKLCTSHPSLPCRDFSTSLKALIHGQVRQLKAAG